MLLWRPYRAGADGHVHTDEDPCSDLYRDADYRAQPDGYSPADLDADADRAAADAHTYTDGNADAGAADEHAHAWSPCAYGDAKAANPYKDAPAGV